MKMEELLEEIISIAYGDNGSEDAYYGEDFESVFHKTAVFFGIAPHD